MAGVAVGGTSSLSSKASRNPSKSIFLVLVRNEVGHVHLAAAGWLALLAAGWVAIFKGGCSGAGAHWIGADVHLAEEAVEAAPMLAAQVPWDMGQSPVLHKEG